MLWCPHNVLTNIFSSFPTHAFPLEIQPYRPPQAVKDAHIAKITSCDDNFAALSSNGELFTFTLPNPSEFDGVLGKEKAGIKPQRVWALRKKFSAVKVCIYCLICTSIHLIGVNNNVGRRPWLRWFHHHMYRIRPCLRSFPKRQEWTE